MPLAEHIAVVGPTFPYKGGIAQHTTELAVRLNAAGHRVELESWAHQYPSLLYPGQQRLAVPEVNPFPETRHVLSWARPGSWWRVGRDLRRRGVGVVVLVQVTPLQVPAYLVLARALSRSTRRILLCHNVLPHESRRFDRPLVRALLRHVDAVLVHSRQQADLVDELSAALPVEVAPLPPHLPETTKPEPRVDRPRRNRLLFFGLVRHYKGLDVLLEALARCGLELQLTVAGEFWEEPARYEQLVRSLRLDSRVDLRPGYVPAQEIGQLFAEADALVMPYRSATASQNAELAFAHGLPVVTTRVGPLAEAVRDGVDGLVAEPGDVDSLAARLRHLYEPGVLERLTAQVHRREDAGDEAWQRYLTALERLGGQELPSRDLECR